MVGINLDTGSYIRAGLWHGLVPEPILTSFVSGAVCSADEPLAFGLPICLSPPLSLHFLSCTPIMVSQP